MKEKILLPFDYSPEFVTYQSVAFPLGIIRGNTQQSIIPWLSSRYINCWFSTNYVCVFGYFDADNWAVDEKILYQSQIILHNEKLDSIGGSSQASLLRNMVQFGYYPYGVYNEEFIPGKGTYQKRYNAHDFIICGYDDSKESFVSAGYLADGNFQQFFIPYPCMNRAIATLHTNSIAYEFYKYNPEATYQLDYAKLVLHMTDYLFSSNSQPFHVPECTWGINAINEVGSFIIDLYEKKKKIDHRCTRAMMEFKKLMHMRISYLFSLGILQDQQYIDYSSSTYHLAKLGHILGIKLMRKKDKNIAYDINEKYKKIVSLEEEYLPKVLIDLSHHLKK